ncbi:hypothetical protein PInf_013658 [Phytophthora infestans]|nr:hypothetical protein PInf_013658 [Phytophthora infestans]
MAWIDYNRFSIRAKTRQGQTTPEDTQLKAEEFKKEVKELILEHNITTALNADQTAVFYEYLPTKTINGENDLD